MHELLDLKERVAMITGGSQGIGRGIACVLGEAGATIYFTGRNRSALESVTAEIERRGGRGIGLACDHVDDAQVETVFQRIREDM